nr:hypothetical protein BaRGS_011054 [Batillaria attramentaria]
MYVYTVKESDDDSDGWLSRLSEVGAPSLSEYDLQESSESEDEIVRYTYDDPNRRAWFFRNGDLHFKPKQVVISPKTYPNFESLLIALGAPDMVPCVAGVRYLFSWPDGREVKSVTEIQNGRYYVCASVNHLQNVNYGDAKEQYWKGGKFKPDEGHLFTKPNGQVVQSPNNPRPRVITLISNMNRDSHEKLILNTSTTQNYEEVLHDLQNMVHIPHPPVTALFTETKPHIKVEGFAHLFRDLRDHKNFLVCGQEGQPIEPKKRPLPSSNSSNESVNGKGSLRNSRLARGDGRMNGESVSPNRRHGRGPKRTEPIRVDINGKKRGELVYFVASIVVLYDRRTHTQKHYTAHTEEITCLAIHPSDPYIASGQVAGRSPEGGAHVRVWDGISLSTYAVIGLGVFQQGVSCVSFSERDSNGDLLLAIDDSDRHVMSVWEWQTETLAAKTTTTNDPVVYGCFYPFDDTILITFGKQHMYFWTVFWKRADGRILRDKKSGIFEDEVPKYVTAVCFGNNGDVITGDSTGRILVWSHDEENIFRIDKQASATMKHAHKKSVSSLVMLSDGVLLSGGGSEIKAWDSFTRFEMVKERALPESHGPVRTIVPQNANGVDGYLFIGTARDLVLEGSLQSKFRPIVQGHCEELWAVAAHPKEPAFFTAGHDMAVAKWSALSHSLIKVVKDKKPCTSIGVDPTGQLVAVGTTTGRVALYDGGDLTERNSLQVGKAQINAVSFSRDGTQLAVGAHDGFIHVFVVHDDGQFFRQQSAALRHNNAFIMHLDWSTDGRYLQTVLGDYDLVFWDVTNMQKLKSGRTVRDDDWNTYTCPVGYPLIGAWQGMGRGDVINVCCRSRYRDFIATGDSVGRLRLFKYPSILQKSDSRTIKPFSSNTTAVEFMADDNYLLASGGSDAALLQYELTTR